jgi:peptidoglycan/LPS O-acetylase OafA/YrhL
VYLGKISYGLYAYHLFAYWVISDRLRLRFKLTGPEEFVLALVLTVGMAALSYQALERPFLRLKRRFTVVPSGSANERYAGAGLQSPAC